MSLKAILSATFLTTFSAIFSATFSATYRQHFFAIFFGNISRQYFAATFSAPYRQHFFRQIFRQHFLTIIFGIIFSFYFLRFFPPCDSECLGSGFGVRVRVRVRVIGPARALWRGRVAGASSALPSYLPPPPDVVLQSSAPFLYGLPFKNLTYRGRPTRLYRNVRVAGESPRPYLLQRAAAGPTIQTQTLNLSTQSRR